MSCELAFPHVEQILDAVLTRLARGA